MSKKESELERYTRKQKLEKEALLKTRKSIVPKENKASTNKEKRKEKKDFDRRIANVDLDNYDDEYEYM